MINILTGQDFPNIKASMLSTKNLPFETPYFERIRERLKDIGATDNSISPPILSVVEIIKSNLYQKEFPEFERTVVATGIIALEIQLESQKDLYREHSKLFDIDYRKKYLIVKKKRADIYAYLKEKMGNNEFFICTRNRRFKGDYTFHDDDMDIILPNYATLPELEKENYSQYDFLFTTTPENFSRKISYRKERGKRL